MLVEAVSKYLQTPPQQLQIKKLFFRHRRGRNLNITQKKEVETFVVVEKNLNFKLIVLLHVVGAQRVRTEIYSDSLPKAVQELEKNL